MFGLDYGTFWLLVGGTIALAFSVQLFAIFWVLISIKNEIKKI